MAAAARRLEQRWGQLELRNTERRLDAMTAFPFFYTGLQQRLGNLQGSIIDQRIQGTGERLCLVVDALQVFTNGDIRLDDSPLAGKPLRSRRGSTPITAPAHRAKSATVALPMPRLRQ